MVFSYVGIKILLTQVPFLCGPAQLTFGRVQELEVNPNSPPCHGAGYLDDLRQPRHGRLVPFSQEVEGGSLVGEETMRTDKVAIEEETLPLGEEFLYL